MTTLAKILIERSRRSPNGIAFTELNRRGIELESLTYEQLAKKATTIAAHLQASNLQDRRLLLAIPQGLNFILAFYASILAKCIPIPHRLPKQAEAERFQFVCRAASVAAILTLRSHESRIREVLAELADDTKHIPIFCIDELQSDPRATWSEPQIDSDTLALIQFTSGTLRAPKGVVVTHRALLENSQAIRSAFGFRGGETIVSWLPFTHDMGLIGHVVQPIYSGLRSVFMSPVTFVADPVTWLRTIANFGADCSGAPNFAYRLCCDKVMEEHVADIDLSSWRLAYCGAERIDPETTKAFVRKFSRLGFREESFFPCYGLAESTLYVTGRHGVHVDHLAATGQEYVSVGATHADHMTLKIVDESVNAECGDRQIGEIWIKSKSNARCYLDNQAATERSFGAILNGEPSYLRTGDLGYTSAGQVFVVGRIKDVIKVRGLAFAAEDVELAMLQKAHEKAVQVYACAAVRIEANSGEAVVGMMELDADSLGSRETEKLADGVKQKVCDTLGLLLEEVLLFKRGELPKTTSGKVKRERCRELYVSQLRHQRAAPISASQA